MIRSLQKKFIRAAMLVVTILLVFFLLAINAANLLFVSNEESRLLTNILEHESAPEPRDEIGGAPDCVPEVPNPDPEAPKDGIDKQIEKIPILIGPAKKILGNRQYFTATVSKNGDIRDKDISHISEEMQEQAEDWILSAFEDGKSGSRMGTYIYRTRDIGDGTVIAFLNTAEHQASLIRVALITLVLGIITWFIMLALVVYLSRQAIDPIARNIERQKQFVTDAGHEIKTPLAIITANVDVLELHTGKSKWIDHIRSQTMRLNDLMQNLLTLSRLDETNAISEAVVFHPGEILSKLADDYAEPAELHGIEIIKNIDVKAELRFYRENFEKLCTIFLDNAVKYAKNGGFIKVELMSQSHDIVLIFRNNCEDLPENDPQELFERFTRGDQARTQKKGGYGIGLAMARAITEAEGGQVKASYEDDNVICFTVRLKNIK